MDRKWIFDFVTMLLDFGSGALNHEIFRGLFDNLLTLSTIKADLSVLEVS